MAALSTGTTVITAEGGEKTSVAIHGGFLQILHNEVTLLTDRAELAEGDVDPSRLAESLADTADE
jgi:F0F1-type ATP synthase epsilon subunit